MSSARLRDVRRLAGCSASVLPAGRRWFVRSCSCSMCHALPANLAAAWTVLVPTLAIGKLSTVGSAPAGAAGRSREAAAAAPNRPRPRPLASCLRLAVASWSAWGRAARPETGVLGVASLAAARPAVPAGNRWSNPQLLALTCREGGLGHPAQTLRSGRRRSCSARRLPLEHDWIKCFDEIRHSHGRLRQCSSSAQWGTARSAARLK